MKKIKQRAAIKQEPHYTGRLGKTPGGGEIRNLNNAKGPTMKALGKSVPARGNSWCKGVKAGTSLIFLGEGILLSLGNAARAE